MAITDHTCRSEPGRPRDCGIQTSVVNWIINGQQGFNNTRYEMLTASEQPYDLKVQDPPDVRWMYLTAWATEDGAVNFRPDIYGLDGSGFTLGQPEPRAF